MRADSACAGLKRYIAVGLGAVGITARGVVVCLETSG